MGQFRQPKDSPIKSLAGYETDSLRWMRHNFARLLYLFRHAHPGWRNPARCIQALHYHNFTESGARSSLDVPVSFVKTQLQRLSERFCFVNAKAALDRIFQEQELAFPRPGLILTLDDGLQSMERILPVLECLDIPLLLFVPVGLCLDDSLESRRSWCLRYYCETKAFGDGTADSGFFDRVMSADLSELSEIRGQLVEFRQNPDPVSSQPLLSQKRLESLARHPLVTLGSHSMSHAPLGMLPASWCQWEIETSVRVLSNIGGDPELFAYPYGIGRALSDAAEKFLARARVRYAFTTATMSITSRSRPLHLGRTGLEACTDGPYLWGTAMGVYEWSYRIKTAVRRTA